MTSDSKSVGQCDIYFMVQSLVIIWRLTDELTYETGGVLLSIFNYVLSLDQAYVKAYFLGKIIPSHAEHDMPCLNSKQRRSRSVGF